MEKREITKVLTRIKIVIDWYEDMTGGEYHVAIDKAQELLEALNEVK